jgi:hypothetical protein
MSQKKGDWRELCEAVMVESDPGRLTELTQQLIRALDERKTNPASWPQTTQLDRI